MARPNLEEVEKILRGYLAGAPSIMSEDLFDIRGDIQIVLRRIERYKEKIDGGAPKEGN